MELSLSNHTCIKCATQMRSIALNANAIACNNCGTIYTVGPKRQLPENWIGASKLQAALAIGNIVSFEKKSFIICGAVQYFYEERKIILWQLQADTRIESFLIEEEGSFYLLDKSQKSLVRNKFQFSKPTEISGESFYCVRKRKVESAHVYGSLLTSELGSHDLHYWISSGSSLLFVIANDSSDQKIAFDARPVTPEQLGLKAKKILEQSPVKNTTCERCSKVNQILLYPFSEAVVCYSCGEGYLLQPNRALRKATLLPVYNSAFALGKELVLKGNKFIVAACSVKQDGAGFDWREYVLVGEMMNTAYLSEFQGHWIFLVEQDFHPVVSGVRQDSFVYEELQYQLFNSYGAKLVAAQGEFNSNIFNDGSIDVVEYIHPPYMWSREINQNDRTVSWFKGTYVDIQEIIDNSVTAEALPRQHGVGVVEPVKAAIPTEKIITLGVLALLFSIIGFLCSSALLQNAPIEDLVITDADTSTGFFTTTKQFELKKWRSNLKISVECPNLKDNWTEVEMDLVNVKTGSIETFSKGLEYYSGNDGGPWEEGSRKEDFYISSLRNGTYYFKIRRITPIDNEAKPIASSTFVHIETDKPIGSNLVLAIVLITLIFLSYYIYIRSKEVTRWKNSPFSAYNQ